MSEYKFGVIHEIFIPGPNNEPLRRDEIVCAVDIQQAQAFASQIAQQGGRNIYIMELEEPK